MFNVNKCAIPTVYCGKSEKIPERLKDSQTYYSKKGSPYECMQKGFGAGSATERGKSRSPYSLQVIKYVGDIHEVRFKDAGINTITDLMDYADDPKNLEKLLKSVLVKKNGSLDTKAYNSVLMHLYKLNFRELPECVEIK